MTQQKIEVEGLPEGWKAVAFKRPCRSDNYLIRPGAVATAHENMSELWLIVEKIQPRRIVLEETEENNPDHDDELVWTFMNGKWWKEVKE